MTGGGGKAVGSQRRLNGAVEGSAAGAAQSGAWKVRAGLVPRMHSSTLPPPIPVTLEKGPRLFGVGSDNVYPLTAGIVEGSAYLVRWNPRRNSNPQSLKYEYQTAFETPSPTFSGPLQRGVGYWRIANDLVNYAVRPPDGSPVEVDVWVGTPSYQGWNLLANPYLQDVALSQQQVRPQGSPASANVSVGSGGAKVLVSGSVWGYPIIDPARPNANGYQLYSLEFPDALDAIPASVGVWVRCLQDATWVWQQSSRQAVAADSRSAVEGAGWLVRLEAQTGSYGDYYNYFGVGNASRQLVNPPPVITPGYVDLRFVGTGRAQDELAAAIVPASRAADTTTWSFVVDSDLEQEDVVLSWPDLSSVPRDVRLFLADVDSGEQVYMRTSSGYTYQNNTRGPRRFEIRSERSGASALRITGITAVPTRGGAVELSYVLSRPADVHVRVTSPTGRTVGASTRPRMARSGANRLTWVPRQEGRALAPGFYVVEVVARTEDGRVAKGISTIRLGR